MKSLLSLATIAFLAFAMCQWAGCSKKSKSPEPATEQAVTRETPDTPGHGLRSTPYGEKTTTGTKTAGHSTTSTVPSPEQMAEIAAQGARAQAMANAPDMVEMRNRFGLEVTSVAINGKAIDVQFMVSTPEKAGQILSPVAQRYLIDQKSGTKILAPQSPRAKRMRATAGVASQSFIASFDNSKDVVKSGDKVSVIVDEYRVDNITVR